MSNPISYKGKKSLIIDRRIGLSYNTIERAKVNTRKYIALTFSQSLRFIYKLRKFQDRSCDTYTEMGILLTRNYSFSGRDRV